MHSRLSTWFAVGCWSNHRRSPKKHHGGCLASDPFRFEGEGLLFRAKLIGKQTVPDARGHGLCQDAMDRLKEAVRASRQHKQRIRLTVSLQGLKIRDEKTGKLLFHHPVNRISFISQDASDARSVGYIYVAQDDSYHYIAVKTEKAATELEVALVDLLQVVLEMKEYGTRAAHQEWRRQLQAWAQPTSTRGVVREAICSPQDACSGEPPLPETTPTVDDLLDLHSERDPSEKEIQQTAIAAGAMATLSSPDVFYLRHHLQTQTLVPVPVTPVGPPPTLLLPCATPAPQSAALGREAPPGILPLGPLPEATAPRML